MGFLERSASSLNKSHTTPPRTHGGWILFFPTVARCFCRPPGLRGDPLFPPVQTSFPRDLLRFLVLYSNRPSPSLMPSNSFPFSFSLTQLVFRSTAACHFGLILLNLIASTPTRALWQFAPHLLWLSPVLGIPPSPFILFLC